MLEDAIQFRHKEKHEARVAEAVWLLDAIEKNERLNQEYRIRLAELDAGGEPRSHDPVTGDRFIKRSYDR